MGLAQSRKWSEGPAGQPAVRAALDALSAAEPVERPSVIAPGSVGFSPNSRGGAVGADHSTAGCARLRRTSSWRAQVGDRHVGLHDMWEHSTWVCRCMRMGGAVMEAALVHTSSGAQAWTAAPGCGPVAAGPQWAHPLVQARSAARQEAGRSTRATGTYVQAARDMLWVMQHQY